MIIKQTNNYDKLDNLHLINTYISVGIENQQFFIVKDFNPTLCNGINSFKIDINLEKFKARSQIQIQALDFDGNPIFIYYYPVVVDSSRLISIFVDDTTAIGPGVLTIIGMLDDKYVIPQ